VVTEASIDDMSPVRTAAPSTANAGPASSFGGRGSTDPSDRSRVPVRAILALGLIALAVVVSACGNGGSPRTQSGDAAPDPSASQPATAESPGAASASPSPTSAVEIGSADLFGVWTFERGGLLSFSDDGRFWIDTHGALGSDPDVEGVFDLVGNELRLTWSVDSIDCSTGTHAEIRVTEASDGRMSWEYLSHDCYPEAAGLVWDVTRISPENRTEPELPAAAPSTRPVGSGMTRGDWHVMGTSIMLEMDHEASYWWDDAGELAWSPAETGSYRFVDDGLELTVETSDICESGDQLLLRDARVYQSVEASAFFVMLADAVDSCGRLAGPVILLLVGI
jgi:hypothetical protein